jgi:hypothetical protein
MDEELHQLAERLRRRREDLERLISERVVDGTEDIVRRLSEMRERMKEKLGGSDGPENGA